MMVASEHTLPTTERGTGLAGHGETWNDEKRKRVKRLEGQGNTQHKADTGLE